MVEQHVTSLNTYLADHSLMCLYSIVIGVRTRGAPGACAPPQVFCLFHAHSICPVLQIHTVPPQSKSLSYTSDCCFCMQIRGTPWTTDNRDRRINVTNLDTDFDVEDANNTQFTATVQQALQPGTNCTFYLCYKQYRSIQPFNPLGKASAVSCVTGKSLHTHTHTQINFQSRKISCYSSTAHIGLQHTLQKVLI